MPTYADKRIEMWQALVQSYEPRPKVVAKIALAFLDQIRDRDAEWEEAARAYAREGYRPHYCPHGMDLWVDYDPICPWCEESWTPHEEAVWRARAVDHEVHERSALYAMFVDQAAQDRSEQADDLRYRYAVWCTEPSDRLLRAHARRVAARNGRRLP